MWLHTDCQLQRPHRASGVPCDFHDSPLHAAAEIGTELERTQVTSDPAPTPPRRAQMAVCALELYPEARKCGHDLQLGQGAGLGTAVMAWTLYIGI